MRNSKVFRLADHRPQPEGGLHGRVTPVGFHVAPETTFDEWCADGETLKTLHGSTVWAIADWLVWGEKKFSEAHAQALGDYFAPETLARYRRVAITFPIERRRVSLYFGHHQAVEGLAPAEQDEVLDLAEKHRWSRAKTREETNRRKAAHATARHQGAAEREPSINLEGTDHAPGEAVEADQLLAATEHPVSEPMPQRASLTTEEAVDLLVSLPAGALPDQVMDAILLVLDQRLALLQLLAVAEKMVSEYDLPDLAEAVALARAQGTMAADVDVS